MSDGARPGTGGEDRFEEVDPRLNVFALANGMDLDKGPGFRRLQWFTEGLERGIVIEAADGGAFDVEVRCWPTGSDEITARAAVGDGVAAADVAPLLETAIETANGL